MNFTLKINIGSWSTPVNGGGYIASSGIVRGSKIETNFVNYRYPVTGSGTIKFFNNEESVTLRSLNRPEIQGKIYADGGIFWNIKIKIDGKYQPASNYLECSFEVIDKYKEILDNWDDRIDVLPDTQAYGVNNDRNIYTLRWSDDGAGGQYVKFIDAGNTVGFTTYLRIERTLSKHIADELIARGDWDYMSGTDPMTIATSYISEFGYPVFSGTYIDDRDDELFRIGLDLQAISPELDPNTISVGDEINVARYDLGGVGSLNYFFVKGIYMGHDPHGPGNWVFLDADMFFGSRNIQYQTGRKLTDIIELIFENLDSSVIFDGYSYTGLNDYEELILLPLADAVLDENFNQSSNPQSKLDLSLRELTDYLYDNLRLVWYINDNNQFRLRHVRQLYLQWTSNPENNIFDYQGINWNERYYVEPVQEAFWYKKIKETKGSADFVGEDITIESHKGIYQNITIDNSLAYTDIEHIQRHGSQYNSSSLSQFVLLNCDMSTESENLLQTVFYSITNADTSFSWNKFTKTFGFINEGGYFTTKFNLFYAQKGDRIRFSYSSYSGDNTVMSGVKLEMKYYSVNGNEKMENQWDLTNSSPTGNDHIANRTGVFFIQIYIDNAYTAAGNNYIYGLSVKRMVSNYKVTRGSGLLSGETYSNMKLSTSKLESNLALYDIPATEAIVNNNLETISYLRQAYTKKITTFIPFNFKNIELRKIIKVDNNAFGILKQAETPLSGDFTTIRIDGK